MPICTAVLAAALLSGPAPADPAPLSAKEPMSPGKQIAAMAMNHPEEPDFVASKALDILDKGAKVGPFFPANDEAENRANGPAANGQSPKGSMTGRQAPAGGTADSRQAGTQPAGGPAGGNSLAGVPVVGGRPAGGPMNGNQANGSQPGSMFTMPATGKNNSQRSPQDVFLHPTSNQPTYTKMSGNDFGRKPSSAKTDDEDAGAWARPLQGWGMPKAGKAKPAVAKAKPKAQVKAQPKAAAGDFWNMPGWD
ncbi:hypothetical protein [Microbispora catharanthi]|uniref:Uncharacterized protein n=1 Tax=Microbispora catharanthi TaxID=1712871 RepID=A0A5N6BVG4_9ACTN|nr:hypothetical protein [Microbispora catharanthi]KAB8184442.1 hypothetical protein FH610_015100 [Microbispora catharanthi]